MQALYLVTDRALSLGRPLEEVVLAAVRGGVGIVQLREKDAPTRFFVEEAQHIKRLLQPYGVPLIINDRVDVALAVEADGVHIGQQDMPYPLARKLLGKRAIIGLSVETVEQVLEAEAYDVDYLGVSPIFPTPTKTDTLGAWGLAGLATVRRLSRHRLVAIGGLNATNAESVIRAGADCIAVVSAICSAPDVEQAAATLRRTIDAALAARRKENL
ncbi:MAG: thiamine phosphate synthase [Anaerolineae bacterium]|nr:thiamine phosphate synthase [Anaerolineae bacterium]